MRQVVSVIEDETVFWGLTRSQRFEINSFYLALRVTVKTVFKLLG